MSVKSSNYVAILSMSLKILVELKYQSNPPIRFTAILCRLRYLWNLNVSQLLPFGLQRFYVAKDTCGA